MNIDAKILTKYEKIESKITRENYTSQPNGIYLRYTKWIQHSNIS